MSDKKLLSEKLFELTYAFDTRDSRYNHMYGCAQCARALEQRLEALSKQANGEMEAHACTADRKAAAERERDALRETDIVLRQENADLRRENEQLRDRVSGLQPPTLETAVVAQSESASLDDDPDALSFSHLRRAIFDRMTHFKRPNGEPTYVASGKNHDWLVAAVTEVGELAKWRTKYDRGDITRDAYVLEARKEVADVVTTLLIYATVDLEVTRFSALIAGKFNEISKRIHSPIRVANDGRMLP